MSKIIEKSNFRVVVEPKRLGDYGSLRVSDSMFYKTQEEREKEYLKRCKQIKEDIERHVNNAGWVDIEFDKDEKCSFCGYGWEVDEETKEPLCCQKAIDEFNQNKIQHHP